MGIEPQIEKTENFKQFIPDPYRTVILISADFELAWAWRYTKNSINPLETALRKASEERLNIPFILDQLERYKIPITWATVGHLFLESCRRKEGISHPEIPRLSNFENKFWKFSGKDWFENDPCSNYINSPEWYCPDLIKMILNSNLNHEIGCHTFSHIDCRDEICPPNLFRAELKECKDLAKRWGISFKSFIHPGYTIGNLDILAEEGFSNFRTDYRNVLGYPKKHKNGLWEFEQTAEFIYRKEWSIDYHIYRYINILKRAIISNTLCVLWFHPSFDKIIVEKIWPEIFQFINENKDKVLVTTHTKYVEWLEGRWKL